VGRRCTMRAPSRLRLPCVPPGTGVRKDAGAPFQPAW
jgi:hypothetical protein